MAKHTFKVHAVSSSSGMETVLHVQADTVQEAINKASETGWMVSHVEGATLPNAPITSREPGEGAPSNAQVGDQLSYNELRAIHARLIGSKLIRMPIRTIAIAVLLGQLAGGLLGLLLAAAYNGLTR